MNRLHLSVLTVCVVSVAAGCGGDAPTAMDASRATSELGQQPASPGQGPQVPFRASFNFSFQLTPIEFLDGAPVKFAAVAAGTGHGKHLGKATIALDQVLDLTVVPNTVVGTVVFGAANGDELHGVTNSTRGQPDAAGNFDFSGTLTITGGTGRFLGASGGGTLAGTASLASFTAFVTYDATISKPRGSD